MLVGYSARGGHARCSLALLIAATLLGGCGHDPAAAPGSGTQVSPQFQKLKDAQAKSIAKNPR